METQPCHLFEKKEKKIKEKIKRNVVESQNKEKIIFLLHLYIFTVVYMYSCGTYIHVCTCIKCV